MERENAYMTVEAALVFPIALGVVLFVVYLLLFQYDRCLLEQDLGAMALWGSLADAPDTAVLEQNAQKRMGELYKDKYAAWRFMELNAELNRNRFSVKGSGQLSFPLPGWNIWGGGNVWSAQARYEYSRLSPVTFIRKCHKFKKFMER